MLSSIGSSGAGVPSVAICFLFSFINSEHEAVAAERARARGFNVSASYEILPQHREFERMSTTTAKRVPRASDD